MSRLLEADALHFYEITHTHKKNGHKGPLTLIKYSSLFIPN